VNTHSSPLPLAVSIHQHYAKALDRAQGVFLLAIRLTWGFLFVQTGWGKWHDIPKVVDFFTGIGIPFPQLNAYLVATTELGGGILLMLGLFSRLVPIPLIVSMCVAYLTTEQDALHELVAGNPDPFFSAAPFLFLFASLLVLVFGPGRLSLDSFLAKRFGTTASAACKK